jgi:hypothetical protein
MSPIERCGSPESMYCTGKCCENPSLAERIGAGEPLRSYLYKAETYGSFSLVLKSIFPCLRQRIVSYHGKIHKDRL